MAMDTSAPERAITLNSPAGGAAPRGPATPEDKAATTLRRNQAIEIRLKQLQTMHYVAVDYSQELIRREYQPPPEPTFDDVLAEATKKINNDYSAHYGMDYCIIAFPVALALFLMDWLWSPLVLMGSAFGVVGLINDRASKKRALAQAAKSADLYIKRRLREFWKAVEEAKVNFETEEGERIWNIKQLMIGRRDMVINAVQTTIHEFPVPFVLPVVVELLTGDPLVTLNFPAGDLLPRSVAGEYGTDLGRQYGDTIPGVLVNIAFELLINIPSFEAVFINAYLQQEEDHHCILGTKISRADAVRSSNHTTPLDFLKTLGATYRLQGDGKPVGAAPSLPPWHDAAVQREIEKINALCKLSFE